jgi:hypothetical protein
MSFDVYTGAIDEKFMFLVAKIVVVLVEKGILGRLTLVLDK